MQRDEVWVTPVIIVIDEPEPPALLAPRGRLAKLMLAAMLVTMTGFRIGFIVEFSERNGNKKTELYGEFFRLMKYTKRGFSWTPSLQ